MIMLLLALLLGSGTPPVSANGACALLPLQIPLKEILDAHAIKGLGRENVSLHKASLESAFRSPRRNQAFHALETIFNEDRSAAARWLSFGKKLPKKAAFDQAMDQLHAFLKAAQQPDATPEGLSQLVASLPLNHDFYAALARCKAFDPSTTAEITTRWLKIEENLRQIVDNNRGLVIVIASEYKNTGVPLADLVSEGNMGLIRAAQKFDPERPAKFSTYAAEWIRTRIRKSLKARLKLKKEKSLAMPLSEDGPTLEGTLSDPEAIDSDELLSLNQEEIRRSLVLQAALEKLPEKYRLVIDARFGLRGEGEGEDFSTLGKRLRMSKQGVHQIQKKALQKLRDDLIKQGVKLEDLF